MNDTLGAGVGGARSQPSLHFRVAAHSALDRLLDAQARATPRTSAARFFGAPVLTEDTRSRYREVVERRAVGAELDRLGCGWVVLNSVPVDGSGADLDHLVIGPPGVFVVTVAVSEVHAWGSTDPAADRIAARRRVRNAEFAVGLVERRLGSLAGEPVRVTGVIAAVQRSAPSRPVGSPDLQVVPVQELAEWFAALPEKLSPAAVDAVAAVAADETIWVARPIVGPIGDPRADFEALRDRVESAARIHRFWLIGLTVSIVGLLVIAAVGALGEAGAFG